MKKILLIGIMFMIVLTGCAQEKTYNGNEDMQLAISREIIKKIDNKESFVFVITADSCSACKVFLDNFDAYSKEDNDAKILYLDLEKEPNETIFAKLINNYIGVENFEGTPTAIMVKKGEIFSIRAGVTKPYDIEELFTTWMLEMNN